MTTTNANPTVSALPSPREGMKPVSRAGERINSVYALDTSQDPVRRSAYRLIYLLAKTYWREDPVELERALSYEYAGCASSREVKNILSGDVAWTPEQLQWICQTYRVEPSYFTADIQDPRPKSLTSGELGTPTTPVILLAA